VLNKKTKTTKIMKKLLKTWRVKLLAILTPEPEIKDDYVNKVVYLLRRDFNTTEQNEILLSVTKKLSELRDLDMKEMELNYERLQRDTVNLRSAISC
jgi:hypothetical protein